MLVLKQYSWYRYSENSRTSVTLNLIAIIIFIIDFIKFLHGPSPTFQFKKMYTIIAMYKRIRLYKKIYITQKDNILRANPVVEVMVVTFYNISKLCQFPPLSTPCPSDCLGSQ